METKEAIRTRRSVKVFDPNYKVSDAQLQELLELTTLAPSAWNFQHYQIIVVRDPEQKKRLRQASLNQEKVEQASVAIVICGDLQAYKRADRVAREFADKGFYGENGAEKVETQAGMMHDTYANNPQKAYDEALRSASLAAMSLMIAANDMGLATCPMIGFDPEAVKKVTGLPEHLFPAIMITLGAEGDFDLPRCDRLPLEEIVHVNHFGEAFRPNVENGRN
ncbi:nitroreductase family protein [Desmospora profundinema]|uniref:Nitroreductase n=1 Tax=Desmospora profundinema TaxID=1571184 RepID=A0ABU1INS2_9BACL|nr:nitroreductase family protein [Desmospora profundinema]MDR6226053.1 nitroreductase [Desmospora profundinema]